MLREGEDGSCLLFYKEKMDKGLIGIKEMLKVKNGLVINLMEIMVVLFLVLNRFLLFWNSVLFMTISHAFMLVST